MTTRSATSSERDPAPGRRLTGASPAFLVAEQFRQPLAALGMDSLEAVFAFEAGRTLAKANIGRFRRRLQFEVIPSGSSRPVQVYLKCYDRPPILSQFRNWFFHRRRESFAQVERSAIDGLAAAGISTPRIVACGEQWGIFFERRSFLITEGVPDSRSLESKLPPCVDGPVTAATQRARREFISRLALFIRRFHETGYRHRDLYLPHIFCSDTGEFCLIDLARTSRPILRRRFQVKDIAQLHYSAPAASFSRTDRLRFYLAYVGGRRLLSQDRAFIRKVVRKAERMASHNRRHGIPIPFLECTAGGK
jgi:hypothetical protein